MANPAAEYRATVRSYLNSHDPENIVVAFGEDGSISLEEPQGGLWGYLLPRFNGEACLTLAESISDGYREHKYSLKESREMIGKLQAAAERALGTCPSRVIAARKEVEAVHIHRCYTSRNIDFAKACEDLDTLQKEVEEATGCRATGINEVRLEIEKLACTHSFKVLQEFNADIDKYLGASQRLNKKAAEEFRYWLERRSTQEGAKEMFENGVRRQLEADGCLLDYQFQDQTLFAQHAHMQNIAFRHLHEWMDSIIRSDAMPAASSSSSDSSPYLRLLQAWDSCDQADRDAWVQLVDEHGLDLLDPRKLLEAALSSSSRGPAEVFWAEFCQIFAHQWGIGIDLERKNYDEAKTTGYFSDYMQMHMAYWLQSFLKDRTPTPSAEAGSSSGTSEPTDMLGSIGADLVEAYRKAILYRDQESGSERFQEMISDLRADKPVVIATGWRGHAVEVLFYPKTNFVAYINRGQRSEGITPGIRLFRMPDKEATIEALEKMLEDPYRRLWITNPSAIHSSDGVELLENTAKSSNIFRKLGLNKTFKIPLNGQKIGNCTWANTIASLLSALVMEQLGQEDLSGIKNDSKELDDIVDKVLNIYKDYGAYCRAEPAKLFLELYRRFTQSGRRGEFSDRQHYQLLSSFAYKALLKLHGKEEEESRLAELAQITQEHFRQHTYLLEDCVVSDKSIKREKATQLLTFLPKGSFLIRRSRHGGSRFAISYRAENTVKHALIIRHNDGRFALHETSGPTEELGKEIESFTTLSELLEKKKLCFPVAPDSKGRMDNLYNILSHYNPDQAKLSEDEIIDKMDKHLNYDTAYFHFESPDSGKLYWKVKTLGMTSRIGRGYIAHPKGYWMDASTRQPMVDKNNKRISSIHTLASVVTELNRVCTSLDAPAASSSWTPDDNAYGIDIEF